MTIPDEAVQAAHAEYHKVLGDSNRSNPMLAALTAALPFLQGASYPRAQALEEAAKKAEKELLERIADAYGEYVANDIADYLPRVREAAIRAISQTVFERCSDCPPVGYPTDKTRCSPCDRALSSQPVADGWLPQDVINLVIAARDAFDAIAGCGIGAEIEGDLDKALEAFSERVPYENEPDALPASPGASE